MKSEIILEMLKNNKIEELKRILEKEVYKNAMKDKDEKSRYSAMQRFFRFSKNEIRESVKKPCKDIEYQGKLYNCFIDGYCFVMTTESLGNMETYDNTNNDYFDIVSLLNFARQRVGCPTKLDLNSVLAIAKSKGYKFKKSEVDTINAVYYLKYKGSYYKIGLLDKAYSIINDGEEVEVYYSGKSDVLIIKNNIGIAGICPIIIKGDIANKIIIEN
ncbi:hypothetical protein [Anaerofustis sp.]|uniref:hypothetical protein n=1 Tax=Anaerofustis sp. TaxID=1872517 RepID=UPI0025BA1C68|nr:hypothetical protein [Anaerofustis sp.]